MRLPLDTNIINYILRHRSPIIAHFTEAIRAGTPGGLMNQLESLRFRYLRDPIPTRLGGLAANLARVASFSRHDGHQPAVSATMHESKWFIEWTAAELSTEETAELVRLQSQLARWEIQSKDNWDNEAWRQDLMNESRRWSEQLIDMSGLLHAP